MSAPAPQYQFSIRDTITTIVDEYARRHKPAAGQLGLFENPAERQKPLFSKSVDDEAGRWVTMRGARVYISNDDGRIMKGPKKLIGKTKEQIEKESAEEGGPAPKPKGLAELGRISGGRVDNRQKRLFEELNPGFKFEDDEDEDFKTVGPVAETPSSPAEMSVAFTEDDDEQDSDQNSDQETETRNISLASLMEDAGDEMEDTKPANVAWWKNEIQEKGIENVPPARIGLTADGKMTVINGRHRMKAAMELGHDEFPAVVDVGGESFELDSSLQPSPSISKPEDFGKSDSTKQGALFDTGKGDLPGQELLFNSDAGDLNNPKTMENRAKKSPNDVPTLTDEEKSRLPEHLKNVTPLFAGEANRLKEMANKASSSPEEIADPILALTDNIMFLRSGYQSEILQQSLGIKNPKMGKQSTINVQKALRKIPGGNVIAAMLATGSEHGHLVEFDRNGFPQLGNDAFQKAIDGKFSREDLNAAKEFLETNYSNSGEFGNVNQYRWLSGVARVARPKVENNPSPAKKKSAEKPSAESIQSHLDNDDHESAFEAFSKLKKDEVDKVARQVLGMGFYNKSKAQMLESLKRTLPLATKTASEAAQKKEEIDYAEMKLRKAKENQQAHSEDRLGAPIRSGVPEIAYTDPHGEGRAEVAKAWQAEVDDAQRELDRVKGVKSAEEDGPNDGDTNAEGLVFRDGRWHRDEEEGQPEAKEKTDPLDKFRDPRDKSFEKLISLKSAKNMGDGIYYFDDSAMTAQRRNSLKTESEKQRLTGRIDSTKLFEFKTWAEVTGDFGAKGYAILDRRQRVLDRELRTEKTAEQKPESPSPSPAVNPHDSLLEQAAKFRKYGQDYNRNIATSANRLEEARSKGHGESMLNHLADELKLRLDSLKQDDGPLEAIYKAYGDKFEGEHGKQPKKDRYSRIQAISQEMNQIMDRYIEPEADLIQIDHYAHPLVHAAVGAGAMYLAGKVFKSGPLRSVAHAAIGAAMAAWMQSAMAANGIQPAQAPSSPAGNAVHVSPPASQFQKQQMGNAAVNQIVQNAINQNAAKAQAAANAPPSPAQTAAHSISAAAAGKAGVPGVRPLTGANAAGIPGRVQMVNPANQNQSQTAGKEGATTGKLPVTEPAGGSGSFNADHPRHPAGASEGRGGEFAPKGEEESGSSAPESSSSPADNSGVFDVWHSPKSSSSQGYSGAASAGLGDVFATDNHEYASQYGIPEKHTAKMQNPYQMSAAEFRSFDRGPDASFEKSKARRQELESAGHDGILVSHADGTKEHILFNRDNLTKQEASPRNYPDNLNKPASEQTDYSPPERSIEPTEPPKIDKPIHTGERQSRKAAWEKHLQGMAQQVTEKKDAAKAEKKQAKELAKATSFNPAELSSPMADDVEPVGEAPKEDDFDSAKDYENALEKHNRSKGAKQATIKKRANADLIPEIAGQYDLDHSTLQQAVDEEIQMLLPYHERREEARQYISKMGWNARRINQAEDRGIDSSSTKFDDVASQWAGMFPEIAGSDESEWVARMWDLSKEGAQDPPSASDEELVNRVAKRLADSGASFSPADEEGFEYADPGPVSGEVGDVDYTPFHRKSVVDLIVDRYMRLAGIA